jgi:hypothetical protein
MTDWTDGAPSEPGWYFIIRSAGIRKAEVVHLVVCEHRDEDYPQPNLWWEPGTNWEKHISDLLITHHQPVKFPPPPVFV